MDLTSVAIIGRQPDLLKLQSQFDAVVEGQSSVVFVVGDPGIGKTTLLEAFAALVRKRGAVILRGSATETEGMPPYLPFLEALGAAIQAAPLEQLREQTALTASVLAGLFPELGQRLGEVATYAAIPPEQARLRLYEAVGQFIAALATTQPLVILFEDMHWAEAATFDLLVRIARTQRAIRVLWLLACRPDSYPAVERARAELVRLRIATTLNLGPLSEGEIGQLALNFLSGPVQAQLTQQLYAQSEGNPFFAEELLRDWRESSRALQIRSVWGLAAAGPLSLPEGIASVVNQRLARQPAEVVELLQAAALIGRSFDLPLVAQITGQSIESIEAHIEQAIRAGLVQAEADGMFTFRHAKIRESLLAQVPVSRRQRWHTAVAQALENRTPQPIAALATHFVRSGERQKGAHYSLLAGQTAIKAYAWPEAIAHYQAALDLLQATDSRRGEALLGLGEAQTLAGQEREAVTTFTAARAWHKQAGELGLAARAAQRLGQAYWRQEDLINARAAFETALILLNDEINRDRVLTLVDLGSLLTVSLHQLDDGLALAQQALQLAQQLEDDGLVAAASRAVGNMLVRGNRLPEGIRQLEAALSLAEAGGDLAEAVECCANLTLAYAWSTEFQRAHNILRRWETFAAQSHDPYQLRHIYSMRAMSAVVDGDWVRAEAELTVAQSVVERLASSEPMALMQLNRGVLTYYRGDYAGAAAAFAAANETFRGLGPGALVWYLGTLSMALAAQGKRAEALTIMNEVEALIGALAPGLMPTSEAMSHLTQAALWLKDQDRLVRYYPLLNAFRGQYHDALVDRLLGVTETLQGDWDKARATLAAAESVARRETAHLELAHIVQAQADLELAQGKRGDPAYARDRLTEAATLFHTLGLTEQERRSREQLRQLSARQVHAYPARLTHREVEVLRLVSQGHSNKQIANLLSLSKKTVGNHITNIFNKIGADNRAAATAFALRNHLVE